MGVVYATIQLHNLQNDMPEILYNGIRQRIKLDRFALLLISGACFFIAVILTVYG